MLSISFPSIVKHLTSSRYYDLSINNQNEKIVWDHRVDRLQVPKCTFFYWIFAAFVAFFVAKKKNKKKIIFETNESFHKIKT